MIDNIGADTCSQVKYVPVEELGTAWTSMKADRGFSFVKSRSGNFATQKISSIIGRWSDCLVFETDQNLHCHV